MRCEPCQGTGTVEVCRTFAEEECRCASHDEVECEACGGLGQLPDEDEEDEDFRGLIVVLPEDMH